MQTQHKYMPCKRWSMLWQDNRGNNVHPLEIWLSNGCMLFNINTRMLEAKHYVPLSLYLGLLLRQQISVGVIIITNLQAYE